MDIYRLREMCRQRDCSFVARVGKRAAGGMCTLL